MSRWKALNSATGPLAEMYASGLACDVFRLGLATMEEDNLEMLGSLLRDTRPVHLSLSVNAQAMVREDSGLLAAFSQEAIARMKVLHIGVILFARDQDVDLEALLVCPSIRSTSSIAY